MSYSIGTLRNKYPYLLKLLCVLSAMFSQLTL